MNVYDGKENYIFISYSHRDSERVIPLVKRLQEAGFRVWYDEGIEAGTEWPEFVATHLYNSAVVLVFLSPNALASQNCTREIHFAIAERKEMLVVHLEELELSLGMKMQLGTLQAMFYYKHPTADSFFERLIQADILQCCKIPASQNPEPLPIEKPAPKKTEQATPAPKVETVQKDAPKPTKEIVAPKPPIPPTNPTPSAGLSLSNSFTASSAEIRKGVSAQMGKCTETSVVIPEKFTDGRPVYNIYTDGFANTNIESVFLPKSVRKISQRAFAHCHQLKAVFLNEGLEEINANAFTDCSALECIVIPKSVTKMEGRVFTATCENLKVIYCEADEQPSDWATNWNDSPATVVWGGKRPQKVVLVPPTRAICDENGLEFFLENENDDGCSVNIGRCKKTAVVVPPVSPNGWKVKRIAQNGFYKSGLKSITLPDGLEEIGSAAFGSCENLKTVTLGKGLRVIGNYAFGLCPALRELALPDSLTKIETFAFLNCRLTHIFIPKSVETIEKNTFYSLETRSYLKGVYCEASEKPSGWDEKWNCMLSPVWGVSREEAERRYEEMLQKAKTAKEEKQKAKEAKAKLPKQETKAPVAPAPKPVASETQSKTITAQPSEQPQAEEPQTVRIFAENGLFFEEYDDHAIVSCGNWTGEELEIPVHSPNGKPVTGVIDEGFKDNKTLKKLVLPYTMQMIGRRAFDSCSALETLIVQSRLRFNAEDLKIGSFAFRECVALKLVSVSIPVFLGDSAFENCTKLARMDCKLQYVYRNAFRGCKELDDIEITATTIFSEAFYECSSLKHLTLTNTKIIHNGAFTLCRSLKTVTLPTSLNRIDADAFKDCSISTVFIPESVTELGRNAFGTAKTYYCEAPSQPAKWAKTGNTPVWYTGKAKIYWGCTPKKMKFLKFFGK
ncbi:MAG: leucine-rich repeat protein [Clostridia bacterium]|nr:leucine-rich repeat protein [Clostridia bacterium]